MRCRSVDPPTERRTHKPNLRANIGRSGVPASEEVKRSKTELSVARERHKSSCRGYTCSEIEKGTGNDLAKEIADLHRGADLVTLDKKMFMEEKVTDAEEKTIQ